MKCKQIYGLFFFFFHYLAYSQTLDSIKQVFVSDLKFSKSHISILAIDIESGDTVLSYLPNYAFATASTTKLFSTALAYELLGPDYKMVTELYLDAPIKNGIVSGDVWIKGAGDVSLGSKFFNAEGTEMLQIDKWIDKLKESGLKEIKGRIVVDGSAFGYEGAPKGWASGDLGNYYGSVAGGINLFDNVINFHFKTGKSGTKPILLKCYPWPTGLIFSNQLKSASISEDKSNILGNPYELSRVAVGRLPSNRKDFVVRGSMPDPEQMMAQYLAQQCDSAGIKVNKGTIGFRTAKMSIPDYDSKWKFLTEESRSVDQIVNWTNFKSVNLFAEGLLRACSYKVCGDGSYSQAIKVEQAYWKTKFDTEGLVLNDGSGLSRDNAISAAHFCSLLKYMAKSLQFSYFYNSLPVAGVSGTVRNLCKGQIGEGHISAKSGSFTGVKSYSGYIKTISGRTLAFAITVNDYSCPTSYVVSKMETILNALVSL